MYENRKVFGMLMFWILTSNNNVPNNIHIYHFRFSLTSYGMCNDSVPILQMTKWSEVRTLNSKSIVLVRKIFDKFCSEFGLDFIQ